jgi:hypothetical protein
MKKIAVLARTDEVFAVMSDQFSILEAYYDTKTGQIIYLDADHSNEFLLEDEIEEGEQRFSDRDLFEKINRDLGTRYLEIPHIESWESYHFMKSFIEKIEDDHLHEVLSAAIQGKGAFRRFKNALLDYPEWRKKWFEFRDTMEKRFVKRWLEENGFMVVEKSD